MSGTVKHNFDFSRYNEGVLAAVERRHAGHMASLGPVPRVPGGWTGWLSRVSPGMVAALAALVASAALLLRAFAGGGEPAVPPVPVEPPLLRIHPDDLGRLNVPPPVLPTLRIEPGDLDRLRVEVPPLRIDPDDLAKLKAPPPPPSPIPPRVAEAAAIPGVVRVVTNFSVFKALDFKFGRVSTEWAYDSSESTAPSRQYCSFAVSFGGGMRTQLLQSSTEGKISFQANNPPGLDSADWQEAMSVCQWFGGVAPR